MRRFAAAPPRRRHRHRHRHRSRDRQSDGAPARGIDAGHPVCPTAHLLGRLFGAPPRFVVLLLVAAASRQFWVEHRSSGGGGRRYDDDAMETVLRGFPVVGRRPRRPAAAPAAIHLWPILVEREKNSTTRTLSYGATTVMNTTAGGRRHQTSPFDLWRARFEGKRHGGYLFFKHIRKAGGTSIQTYLNEVALYHEEIRRRQCSDKRSAVGCPGRVSLYTQHWYAMDRRCPSIDPRWNDTLSVVCLRHPVERHLSEFFYSGPGSRGQLRELHRRRAYATDLFASLLRSEMTKWIEDGVALNRKTGGTGRHFTDNLQARTLAGDTDAMPAPYDDGPRHECPRHVVVDPKIRLVDPKLVINDGCESCRHGCDGPCIYGGMWGGGVSAGRGDVTGATQRKAMQVLESFDVVLLTESFADKEQAAFVADLVGVPLVNASLAATKKNVRLIQWNGTVGRYGGYQDILEGVAPELLDSLRRHSQFEMDLYRHAEKINEERFLQWKETPSGKTALEKASSNVPETLKSIIGSSPKGSQSTMMLPP